MNILIKNVIIICVIGILCSGCKVPKFMAQRLLKTMPETYLGAKDTTNIADIPWNVYFSDSMLVNLIDEALKNNTDVLAMLQRVEMAKTMIKAREGALSPSVSGSIAPSLRKFGLYTMDGSGNATTEIIQGKLVPINLPDLYLGLQTSWEIDIWGRLKNQKQAAVQRYLSTIEGKNFVITNLIVAIALNYYELLMLDNQLDSIRETIKLQEEALATIIIQKEAGRANELAVKQFEAQVFQLKSLEVEKLQNISEVESNLNLLLGRYPQAIARNKSMLRQAIPTQISAGIPAQLMQNRPDIRQAEYELWATKLDVLAARAAYYPTVNISGSVGFQAFNPVLLAKMPQSIAYGLLSSIIAPLINKKTIEANYLNANAIQQEAFLNYQKSILIGYMEVNNELLRLNNLAQIQDFKIQEVEVQNRSTETVSELFKSNRATYLEVLTTQQNALQSKLELLTIQQQQHNTLVNIYKALGGGWK